MKNIHLDYMHLIVQSYKKHLNIWHFPLLLQMARYRTQRLILLSLLINSIIACCWSIYCSSSSIHSYTDDSWIWKIYSFTWLGQHSPSSPNWSRMVWFLLFYTKFAFNSYSNHNRTRYFKSRAEACELLSEDWDEIEGWSTTAGVVVWEFVDLFISLDNNWMALWIWFFLCELVWWTWKDMSGSFLFTPWFPCRCCSKKSMDKISQAEKWNNWVIITTSTSSVRGDADRATSLTLIVFFIIMDW